jgi:hypothetical protein
MNCNTIPHDQSSALVPMRISERQQRQCSYAMAQRIATATTVNIIPKPRPHTTNCSHILYILCVRRSTDRWLNVYTLYIITFLPKIPACTLPALPNPTQHPVNDVYICLRMCMRAVRLVEPNQSAKENQKRKPFCAQVRHFPNPSRRASSPRIKVRRASSVSGVPHARTGA